MSARLSANLLHRLPEMPRLIFINRFYWPEEPATSQLLTDLAEGLVQRGHQVTVITSRPDEITVPNREKHHGVDIIRIGSSRLGRKNLFGRVLDFLSFILGCGGKLVTEVRRGDTVIFLTDPPLLAALLWPLLSFRKVRYVHWIQDIYPEIACELTGQRWLRFLIPWRNLSWRRAFRCVTLGEDMTRVLAKGRVCAKDIQIIPNWAPKGIELAVNPEDIQQLKSKWGLTGKFVALYSGNLGRVHDLSPLIEVATHLAEERDIALVFVGHGAQVESLRRAATERGVTNIHFHPPQPRAQLNTTLALGDVHFVSLRPGCESYVYPSKLYGIAAVGKSVLFIGPHTSALARAIVSQKLGLSFKTTDTLSISEILCKFRDSPILMGDYQRHSKSFSKRHHFTEALNSWEALLTCESNLADQ